MSALASNTSSVPVQVNSSFLDEIGPSDCRLALELLRNPGDFPIDVLRPNLSTAICHQCFEVKNLRHFFDYAPRRPRKNRKTPWRRECHNCRSGKLLWVQSDDLNPNIGPPHLNSLHWKATTTLTGGFIIRSGDRDSPPRTVPIVRSMAVNLLNPDIFAKMMCRFSARTCFQKVTPEAFTGYHLVTFIRGRFHKGCTGLLLLMGPSDESSTLLPSFNARLWYTWELEGEDFTPALNDFYKQGACGFLPLQLCQGVEASFIIKALELSHNVDQAAQTWNTQKHPQWRNTETWPRESRSGYSTAIDNAEFSAFTFFHEQEQTAECQMAYAMWILYQAYTVMSNHAMENADAVRVWHGMTENIDAFYHPSDYSIANVLWHRIYHLAWLDNPCKDALKQFRLTSPVPVVDATQGNLPQQAQSMAADPAIYFQNPFSSGNQPGASFGQQTQSIEPTGQALDHLRQPLASMQGSKRWNQERHDSGDMAPTLPPTVHAARSGEHQDPRPPLPARSHLDTPGTSPRTQTLQGPPLTIVPASDIARLPRLHPHIKDGTLRDAHVKYWEGAFWAEENITVTGEPLEISHFESADAEREHGNGEGNGGYTNSPANQQSPVSL